MQFGQYSIVFPAYIAMVRFKDTSYITEEGLGGTCVSIEAFSYLNFTVTLTLSEQVSTGTSTNEPGTISARI